MLSYDLDSGASPVPVTDGDAPESVSDVYSSHTLYTANLPEPYLSYMVAYANDVPLDQDYLVFITRASKYEGGQQRTSTVYNFAVGDIDYVSGSFTGDVMIYSIYASPSYFGQFTYERDSSFVVTPGSNLVYTSIDSYYPDLRSPTDYSRYSLFFTVFLFLVFSVSAIFYRHRN